MSRPRVNSRKGRCQRLSLRIRPSIAVRRTGRGIMPSPRGHAIVDIGFKLFGGMSVSRVCITLGRVDA